MDASRFSATIVARRKACRSIYSQLIWVNNRSTSTASTAVGVIIKISCANNLFVDSVSGASFEDQTQKGIELAVECSSTPQRARTGTI
jgi:hypothetical protein